VELKRGRLADFFEGVAAKLLSPVDTSVSRSNQHEINGSKVLRELLGDRERKLDVSDDRFEAAFIWLNGEQESIVEEGRLSWYDSRKNVPSRRPEWRLYYQGNAVTDLMRPGDALFVAKLRNGRLMLIVTPGSGTLEKQLLWLFGLPSLREAKFAMNDFGGRDPELDFAAKFVLDELGVEYEEPEDEDLDRLLAEFEGKFPTTAAMSRLARNSLPEVDCLTDPDLALTMWLEREEQLFRRLERGIVAARLQVGFGADGADVDGFLAFSLSIQNRRKSRMGLALENHLDAIFSAFRLRYERGALTESKARPDFLFPGAAEYRDAAFPSEKLLMLGAKSTCKDRWRQVLAEADRISSKHLLTLEPSISEVQTSEMRSKNLNLVLPRPIHRTYSASQQSWLLTLSDFIRLAKSRDDRLGLPPGVLPLS
jgi:hypothetical protein